LLRSIAIPIVRHGHANASLHAIGRPWHAIEYGAGKIANEVDMKLLGAQDGGLRITRTDIQDYALGMARH
jgi:hypothetical protein